MTGVNAGNLLSINSALNTPYVTGALTTTKEQIQTVVGSYQAILNAADGIDNVRTSNNPAAQIYQNIGVTGVDSAVKASLLGDVIDVKSRSDVDTVPEVQALADAVAAVMKGAAGGIAPSLEQLEKLNLIGVNPGNLEQLQQAIEQTKDDGSDVDTLAEIQALIDRINAALGVIRAAAESNTAAPSSPSTSDYINAGVQGVTDGPAATRPSSMPPTERPATATSLRPNNMQPLV